MSEPDAGAVVAIGVAGMAVVAVWAMPATQGGWPRQRSRSCSSSGKARLGRALVARLRHLNSPATDWFTAFNISVIAGVTGTVLLTMPFGEKAE